MGFNWSNMLGGSIQPGAFFDTDNDSGSMLNWITDPLDLSGNRAGDIQDEINARLLNTNAQNIALQESQLAEIQKLFQPFTDAAKNTALPNLSSLAFGGSLDYQPSQLFGQQLTQGREGILGQQAAGGAGLKSSNTFSRLSDLVSGLASEDMGRFEKGNLGLLQAGIGSEGALNQASNTLGNNISASNQNLGNQLNQSYQNYGQQRQQSMQSLGSGLSGLADYFGTQ